MLLLDIINSNNNMIVKKRSHCWYVCHNYYYCHPARWLVFRYSYFHLVSVKKHTRTYWHTVLTHTDIYTVLRPVAFIVLCFVTGCVHNFYVIKWTDRMNEGRKERRKEASKLITVRCCYRVCIYARTNTSLCIRIT